MNDVIDLDSFNNDLFRSRNLKRRLQRAKKKASRVTELAYKKRAIAYRGWKKGSPKSFAVAKAEREAQRAMRREGKIRLLLSKQKRMQTTWRGVPRSEMTRAGNRGPNRFALPRDPRPWR